MPVVDYETLLAEIVDPAPPALVRHIRAIANGGEKLTRKDVRMIVFGFLASTGGLTTRYKRTYRDAILASMQDETRVTAVTSGDVTAVKG